MEKIVVLSGKFSTVLRELHYMLEKKQLEEALKADAEEDERIDKIFKEMGL